jgi:hypothetical protein
MSAVRITPTTEHPTPYDTYDEDVPTLLEELAVAGNTAELQGALRGDANLTLNYDDAQKQARFLKEVVEKKNTKYLKNPVVAVGAAAFIRQYGQSLAFDAAATRAAITSKLMEIANCGDPKYELRALEMLGKHSDIGLFTDRSEITINYKSPEALEEAIKERVKRLLNADIIDVTPLVDYLDEEPQPETSTHAEDGEDQL